MPNSFMVGSTWWNSKAASHLLYPQIEQQSPFSLINSLFLFLLKFPSKKNYFFLILTSLMYITP